MRNLWPGALVEIRTPRGLRLARVIRATWPHVKIRHDVSKHNVMVRIRDGEAWSGCRHISRERIAHVYTPQRGKTFERIGLPHVRPVTRKSYQRRRAA